MTQQRVYTLEERYAHIREAIGDLITKGQEQIQEEQQQNPGESWSNDVARKITDSRKKWNEQSFQIAVLALVKAGKSTLINSWLGNEYMPTSHVPETARIVRIRHKPGNREGTLTDRNKTPIHGVVEICDYLRRLNADVREQGTLPPVDELVLEAPLVALENHALGEQSFEILDTPGPNEAGTNLKEKIEEILDKVDVIIYLLDYTKIKTVEEAEMFAKLAQVRLDLLNSQRLFFVVNKVDVENRHDSTLDATAKYVANVLRTQIQGLKITPERILFISAEEALLSRLVESGQASRKALKDFAQKAFGILNEGEPTLEECQPLSPRLFKKSRMLELEKTILASIYSQRGTILLESLLSDLNRHLKLFDNGLVTRITTLQANQRDLKDQVEVLERDLDEINNGLGRVTSKTTKLQKEIEDLLKSQFASFQNEANNTINYAFGSQYAGTIIDQTIDKFASRIKGFLNISSSNKSTVEDAAQKLNEEVADYLSKRFERFIYALSGHVQRKQMPLFDELRNEVARLSRQIEAVVGKTLQISLLPVSVVFEPPSQIPLDQAISAGVKSTSRTVSGSYEEKYVRFKILWIPVYGTRTRYTSSTYTTHTVDSVATQEFWQTQIREKMQEMILAVNEKIDQEIHATIQRAEEELRRYSDNYIDNIKRSMATASQGEQQRKNLLEQAEKRRQQLAELRKTIADYQKVLERLKAVS
jgi:small GTP-binding protein